MFEVVRLQWCVARLTLFLAGVEGGASCFFCCNRVGQKTTGYNYCLVKDLKFKVGSSGINGLELFFLVVAGAGFFCCNETGKELCMV